jgi:hypothetical protein
MAYIGRHFDSIQEMTDYLNDVVLSGPLGERVLGLHGKTLIINDGGADRVVTFSDPTGVGLTPNQIRQQIYDTHSGLQGAVELRNYRVAVPPTPQIAIVTVAYYVKATGTANALLGFSTTSDTTVGDSAVAQADIITIQSDESGNKFSLVHQ